MVKYLARYLTGGPISDRRIIAADADQVTFWAREGKTPGGDAQSLPVTLATEDFVQRWALHILPQGYTKTRRYGGWHNTRRERYLERCAIMLESDIQSLSPDATEFNPWELLEESLDSADSKEGLACPKCGHPLQLIDFAAKPSWSQIMTSAHRPSWYARDQLRRILPRPVTSG